MVVVAGTGEWQTMVGSIRDDLGIPPHTRTLSLPRDTETLSRGGQDPTVRQVDGEMFFKLYILCFISLSWKHMSMHVYVRVYVYTVYIYIYFKNTGNLFIHMAQIPIGDSPRVHPNILKCPLHSPVAKGYRLVVFATRAMVCKTPTYYLILYPLAYARGCVILRSHILILLLFILLIFHHIHS